MSKTPEQIAAGKAAAVEWNTNNREDLTTSDCGNVANAVANAEDNRITALQAVQNLHLDLTPPQVQALTDVVVAAEA